MSMTHFRATPAGQIFWRLLLGGSAVVLGAMVWSACCTAPLIAWNPQRLASAYVIANGLSLYPGLETAAQPGWFYGPGFPLVFLPITLIQSPTCALMAATGWGAAWVLGPLWFLFSANEARPRAILAAVLLAGFLIFSNRHTEAWITFVHVDGPAIGWLVIAAAAAFRYDETGRKTWLHIGVFAAVAAAWTKQTDLIFAVAIGMWWLARCRWAAAWAWIFWCAIYGAVATVLIFGWLGAGPVLLYTVELHAHNPWRPGSWWDPVRSLADESLTWLILLGITLALRRMCPGQAPADRRFSTFLWWLGCVQLPLGIMAAMKVGGGLNSFHGMIFLLAVVAFEAVRLVAHRLEPGSNGQSAVAVCLWLVAIAPAVAGMTGRWQFTPDWQQENFVQLACSRPEGVCFPWNPLITLLAEGKQMPTEDGLGCLALEGLRFTNEEVQRVVGGRLVVFDQQAPTRDLMQYLPGRTFLDRYRSSSEPGRERTYLRPRPK